MSMTSATRVKFQNLGKFLALNIHFVVANVLLVAILHCFKLNLVGNVRFYWKTRGKMSQ